MIDLDTPLEFSPREIRLLQTRARPRLLVSVRDVTEASAAIAGGCDILDVKEPLRGAMGYAGLETIQAIASAVSDETRPLSVALGEVLDWQNRKADPLPQRVTLCKIGLAGLGHDQQWKKRLLELRQRFDALRVPTIGWVTVAYADYQAAHSPPPQEIFEWALETQSTGFLIDTWGKTSGNVFDLLGTNLLQGIMARGILRDVGCGLAGRILPTHIPKAVDVHPAVIAVRSAACRDGDRRLQIDRDAVRSLQEAIAAAKLHARPFRTLPGTE